MRLQLFNRIDCKVTILFISFLLGAVFLWSNLFFTLEIKDDGLLSHSAERVFLGEIPHIDFEDPYTGGLSYLHALSFKIWGISSDSTRYCYFTLTIAFIAYLMGYLHKQNGSVFIIISAQWLFILLCPLNYTASMPTWYISYLGMVAGTLLIKRNNEIISKKDLTIAGICCGLAVLLKINAVIIMIAATWVLIYSRSDETLNGVKKVALIDHIIMGLISTLLLVSMLSMQIDISAFLYFILPIIFIIFNPYAPTAKSKKSVLISVNFLVFVFFFSLPLIIYGIYFYANSGIGNLVNGIFILPRLRAHLVTRPPPSWISSLVVVFFSLIAWRLIKKERSLLFHTSLACFVLFQIIFNPTSITLDGLYYIIGSIPLACSLLLILNKESLVAHYENQWMFFIVFLWLLQYPYFNAVYVAYSLVYLIIFLCLVVNNSSVPRVRVVGHISIVFVLGIFAVIRISAFSHFSSLYRVTDKLEYCGQLFARMPLQSFTDISELKSLVQFVDSLEISTREIIAFPDSPEIYFYLNLKNPTRAIYNALSSDWTDYNKYYELAVTKQLPLTILWTGKTIGDPLDQAMINKFKSLYGNHKDFGEYMVLWGIEGSV